YEPLHLCRVRRLGGSTGRQGWGAWCKTLCREDFKARSDIPYSGWPIKFEEMVPHYRRAFETCGFTDLDSEAWFEKPNGKTGEVGLEHAFLAPLNDFADGWKSLSDAGQQNLTLFYNATVTELHTEGTAEVVNSVEFSDGRRRHRLTPKVVVLATGGIENARLLLLSDRTHTRGLGNSRDLVGRFFMEHPRFRWGHITTGAQNTELVDLDPSEINRSGQGLPAEIVMRLRKGLVLSPSLREREGLLASRSWLQPVPEVGEGKGAIALREAGFWLAKGRQPAHPVKSFLTMARHPVDTARALSFYKGPSVRRLEAKNFCFNSIFEQAPQPDSYVTLSKKRDKLGRRQASLHWRINEQTRDTVRRTQTILADYLRGLGHKVDLTRSSGEDGEMVKASWVRHHMGTTRMSQSPSDGVVDTSLRVHGMHNLFIAGSSVFPTVGNDMPTLTAIALAHRLSDELEHLLDNQKV
ncbi:MAG: GMC oxidoreductase, partial [Dinoroseobacter sp.]|nr:GMC oxidoreductase [Dinoroseobacter sp.]